jgi:membrane protein
MLHMLRLLRRAIWRALEHDCFAIAKGAAYSSILTLFPAMLVVASVLAMSHQTTAFLLVVSSAVGHILPEGTSQAARVYFEGTHPRPIGLLISASIVTLFAASGVLISWMEGFRKAYKIPKTWGIAKERAIAFFLVALCLLPMGFAVLLAAFGSLIEDWMIFHSMRAFGPMILFFFTGVRWLISTLASVALLSLIYHWAIPRTQPIHKVMPGAALATTVGFAATWVFGWYVTRFAEYSALYGPLGVAIALLVWLYILSIVVLIGAEFNALIYPRTVLTMPEPSQPQDREVQVR